jgi:DNA-binding GntR family transcriptional regulator
MPVFPAAGSRQPGGGSRRSGGPGPVQRDLEAEIDSGALPPDTRLPSEAELAEQYGVARITVRSAIAMLRDAGKVVTVHGRGSFTSP